MWGAALERLRNGRTLDLLLIIVGSLWFSILVARPVERLDLSALAFLVAVPIPYFVGLALLLAVTAIWLLRSQPTYGWVLPLLLTLYLFIGPELLEVNGRVNDTYDWLLGITYIESGRFSLAQGFGYAVYPGYFFFVHALSKVTGIGYYALAPASATVLHLARAVSIFAFGTSVLHKPRLVTLFALLLTAMLWMPGTHPSPHGLGFVISLILLAFAARHRDPSPADYTVLTLLFVVSALTHPVSAGVVLGYLWLMSILSPLARGTMRFDVPRLPWGVLAAASSIFLGWLLYVATYVLEAALTSLPRLLHSPAAFPLSLFTQHLTSYRAINVYFSLFYSLAVASWVVLVIVRRRLWLQAPWSLIPLFGLLPPLITLLISFNAYDSFQRIYEYGVPFVVWFVVYYSRDRVRSLVTPLLLASMLFFVGRYSTEAVAIFPSSEIPGASFVMTRINMSDRILSVGFRPRLAALANVPDLSRQTIFEDTSNLVVINGESEEWNFMTTSITTANYFRYWLGDRAWQEFQSRVARLESGLVYSNGNFRIFRVDFRPG
jgi:hypothetical protein